MSVHIKINSGEERPFALEVTQFPKQVFLEKPDKILVVLPFGLFLLAMLFFAFDLVTALGMGAALVSVTAFAYWRGQRSYVLNFEKDRVLVLEPGIFRDHEWQAAYSEYEGVFQRSRTARSGSASTTYQIIELKHPEPQKTLPLYVHKTMEKPISRLASYAKLFGLAAKAEDE